MEASKGTVGNGALRCAKMCVMGGAREVRWVRRLRLQGERHRRLASRVETEHRITGCRFVFAGTSRDRPGDHLTWA
jgi:hypothetical protein